MKARKLLFGVVTLLVAMLGLASPAHALFINELRCDSADNVIKCSVFYSSVDVDPKSLGFGQVTVSWTGGPNPPTLKVAPRDGVNQQNYSFRCVPALFFGTPIGVSVILEQGERGLFSLDTRGKDVQCVGSFFRGLFALVCEPTPTALALLPNGNYIVCHTAWAPDGSAAAVRWVAPSQRAPVVSTNSAEGWTRAVFNCNNPGGPDQTFSSFVEVTDASGTMRSSATIPCGW